MQETMIGTTVTYTLKYGDKLLVIEDVPARVCQETGEEFFVPETVERVHFLIQEQKPPERVIETPVYKYA